MPEAVTVQKHGLKGFQLKTVDYVFDRLYGEDATSRFLIADEVGLGKTLVARGIIDKTLEHLKGRTDRIDIIYVCSNAAIAAQNVKRLIPPGVEGGFSIATRLTYLPKQVSSLRANKVNFVSLTPTTAFDHNRSRGGQSEERIILYRMLNDLAFAPARLFGWWQRGQQAKDLKNLLQATSGTENWQRQISESAGLKLDADLTSTFRQAVQGDPGLCAALSEGCDRFRHHRELSLIPSEDSEFRYDLIARLRRKLASLCLSALEPDLVILDEFQRFKDLLGGESEAAELAAALFAQPEVRVLLLSATPYKMFTLDRESSEDDHYPDFLRTLAFLYEDQAKVSEVEKLISEHRQAMQTLANGSAPHSDSKTSLERALLQVMCRTERASMTQNHNSMLVEISRDTNPTVGDLKQAAAVDGVAEGVEGPDQIEYWKATPYVLNYMRQYELRKKLDPQLEHPAGPLHTAIAAAAECCLTREELDDYRRIDPGNARLRTLFEDTINQGMWQLLWMPPSVPYTEPTGVFRGKEKLTKALVFSAWNAVPNAIASITSYEAERRMVEDADVSRTVLYDKVKPLLRFAASSVDGRLTGMPVIAWMLPCPALATEIDPLRIALSLGRGPVNPKVLRDEVTAICRKLIAALPESSPGNREDERWYWAAPILLGNDKRLLDWCKSASGWRSGGPDQEKGTRFDDHLDLLVSVAEDPSSLGPKPSDLADVLCDLALGGPGVCALRALGRLDPSLDVFDEKMLTGAAVAANAFRTLFNTPENIAMLRGGEDSYWRLTLQYAIDGNLQAVLDEYVHVLRESLGLQAHEPLDQVDGIALAIAKALALRAAQVRVDEIRPVGDGYEIKSFNARGRFALRFADLQGDDSNVMVRADAVRDAFNSPFRPFVLASTSIGQEGLDFHTWCHAVWHWNLPSNPVDLEQREGRVHRYKGHAVRKNIAECYGLRALPEGGGWSDPWAVLFALAARDYDVDDSGLIPYWVFEEGSAKVERHVPLLPFSREVSKLKSLKEELALYRLVFGQPRQEDLLAMLGNSEEQFSTDFGDWLVSLAPPERSG